MPGWVESQGAVSLPKETAEVLRNAPVAVAQNRPAAVANHANGAEGSISIETDWLFFYGDAMTSMHPAYLAGKRLLDLMGSFLLLLIMSPLILLISVLIVIDSPGAPIFRQLRKGRNQRPFAIYKFRTMSKEARQQQANLLDQNEVDGILFKLKKDPRITRVGRFLRAYSVDELPQLFNVLIGDMSLVGPRPFSLDDFNRSSAIGPNYEEWINERHRVLPGITGLWQISGRNDIPFEKLMELDLLYVRRCNPVIDAIILKKTVGVVLNRKGAY